MQGRSQHRMAAEWHPIERALTTFSTAFIISLLAVTVIGTSSNAASPSQPAERSIEIRTLLDLSDEQLDRIESAAASLPYALPPIAVVERCAGIDGYPAGTPFWGCYFDGDDYIRLTPFGASQPECEVRGIIMHELQHMRQWESQMAPPGLRVGGDEPGWWHWREVDARVAHERWGCA